MSGWWMKSFVIVTSVTGQNKIKQNSLSPQLSPFAIQKWGNYQKVLIGTTVKGDTESALSQCVDKDGCEILSRVFSIVCDFKTSFSTHQVCLTL